MLKKRGLKNRFPPAVRSEWIFWHSCLVCGGNNWDALHHIISPTVRFYQPGKHNKSILNSCPIHNFKCHLYNEAYLHKEDVIKSLLQRVLEILVVQQHYRLKAIDIEFLKEYNKYYVKED